MVETHVLTNLLSQISTLNKHYKRISELSGEEFNVFRILDLASSEVRMHSAFIAELLNPRGTHGQGAIFLKLFIDKFCFKGNDFDFESCKVDVEKYAGFINEDRTEGGRIDIVIADRFNNHIIVENKIYAGDQNNQLVRYANHSKKADLFYLTLNGDEPTDSSKGSLCSNKDFKCLSYTKDITGWLEKCRKEMTVMPIIRESLTQYIYLIKYLTNQTTNDNMRIDLSKIITSNLEASFLIADNLKSSLNILLDKLDKELEDIAQEFNLEYYNNISLEENYSGFIFSSPDWEYASINFQFWSYEKKLVYGISAKDNPVEFPAALRTAIDKAAGFKNKPNDWWPTYHPMEQPYDNWGKYPAWEAIENGEMARTFRDKIVFLLNVVKGLEL